MAKIENAYHSYLPFDHKASVAIQIRYQWLRSESNRNTVTFPAAMYLVKKTLSVNFDGH